MTGLLHSVVFGPNYRWWALSVVALAIFMATTDHGLINISLPVIITDLNADLALAGWIAFIYALVTGSLYLPCGRLSDVVGRRTTFSYGFLLYAVSSAIAGASQGPGQLVFFRAAQAVGSALMMANTFALVTSLFPPEERGRAMGISGGTVSAIGFTVGPVLGGFLTHAFGWRSVFYISAGLGVVGYFAVRFILREDDRVASNPKKTEPFDFVGTVAFIVGLSAFLLALTTGQKQSWISPLILGELSVAILSLGFFVWWEGRTPYPLLDLSLFRIRLFVAGNLARLASFVSVSMNHLLMPFFLQFGLALDPLQAGILMTPTALALAVLSPVTGWLSERMGARLLSSAGLVIKGVAFVMLSFLHPGSTAFDIIVRLALLGVGLGLFQTPNNNSLMSSIPHNRLGVGSSFLSIVRSVGQSIGAASATTIVSAVLLRFTGQTSLGDLGIGTGADRSALMLSAFMTGFKYTYLVAALLCFAGAIASGMRGPLERGRTNEL